MKFKIQKKKKEKITQIRKTNKNINSYSVTIPKQIIDLLDLTEQDKIKWIYTINNDKVTVDIDIIRSPETEMN